jgi:hypothetical protein
LISLLKSWRTKKSSDSNLAVFPSYDGLTGLMSEWAGRVPELDGWTILVGKNATSSEVLKWLGETAGAATKRLVFCGHGVPDCLLTAQGLGREFHESASHDELLGEAECEQSQGVILAAMCCESGSRLALRWSERGGGFLGFSRPILFATNRQRTAIDDIFREAMSVLVSECRRATGDAASMKEFRVNLEKFYDQALDRFEREDRTDPQVRLVRIALRSHRRALTAVPGRPSN